MSTSKEKNLQLNTKKYLQRTLKNMGLNKRMEKIIEKEKTLEVEKHFQELG